MTSKASFTDEEWERVRRAPIVAGMAITIADPGGPIEISKEGMATLRAATVPPSQQELLAAVALDIQAMMQQKQNPARDFKPTSAATAGTEILAEMRAVDEIVAEKSTPEETEAFRGWLITTAQAAADAAKEGGFMGFGAVQVSEGEQAMLDQLRGALGQG
jgi:transcription antitermination factor NusG